MWEKPYCKESSDNSDAVHVLYIWMWQQPGGKIYRAKRVILLLWPFFTPIRVLFKAQYLFHCAPESGQTQLLYRQVLGLCLKFVQYMMHRFEDIK